MTKEDQKISEARECVKAARYRLAENGHQDGCQCNLCSAVRYLARASGIMHKLYTQTKPPRTARKRVAKKSSDNHHKEQ